ncbi:MAG: hypothetical protein D8M58_21375 [Calditrichaeota bacterium]|nr:MAG: hypothetical protein DWQ03_00100 [Calditrichota bacterium]MBL1207965.1 hypothetical protein [Calditrichota bacterium]NOG47801.1 hypothetical protein [Calditrichota bacterium]
MEDVIISNKKNSFLDPVCWEWISIINRFCSEIEEEVPYYYNERSNVSIFAGALWRNNYLAMEEFGIEKGKRKKYTGRSDLWFQIGNTDYYCEAKFKFVSLASKDIKSQIKSVMESAKKDVNKIDFKDNEKSISMVFICPHLSINNKDINSEIDSFLKIIKKIPADVKSWVFPQNRRDFIVDNKYYPGIVLLLSLNN